VTRRSVLLDAVVPVLYVGMLIVSMWIVLRGHNEPGGGFIGGMIAVAATAARAVVGSVAEAGVPGGAVRLTSLGVALSLASGLPGLFVRGAYLTHLWATVPLGVATVDVSTVLVFDAGVYLAVWGALGGFAAHMIALAGEDRR
jgi:multicomponent Na+:H+ antiporter subunit B